MEDAMATGSHREAESPIARQQSLNRNGEGRSGRDTSHDNRRDRDEPEQRGAQPVAKKRRVMSAVAVVGAQDSTPRPIPISRPVPDNRDRRRTDFTAAGGSRRPLPGSGPAQHNAGYRTAANSNGHAAREAGGGAADAPQQPAAPPPPRRKLSGPHAEEIMKRDKRMFGALMGHLGAARQRLDRDKAVIDTQARLARSVADKQQQQSQQLRQLERELEQQRRNLDMARRAEAAGRVQVEERVAVTQLWLKAQEPLRGVLVTRALPPLTWLPNEHNDITQAMAQAQRAAVDDAMQARLDEDEDFARSIEEDIEAKFPGVRARAGTGGIDVTKLVRSSSGATGRSDARAGSVDSGDGAQLSNAEHREDRFDSGDAAGVGDEQHGAEQDMAEAETDDLQGAADAAADMQEGGDADATELSAQEGAEQRHEEHDRGDGAGGGASDDDDARNGAAVERADGGGQGRGEERDSSHDDGDDDDQRRSEGSDGGRAHANHKGRRGGGDERRARSGSKSSRSSSSGSSSGGARRRRESGRGQKKRGRGERGRGGGDSDGDR
ncbi:hypothetical protein JKP88DRAFT_293793 [Tribonema minus]|uniref:Pinin/SDK/MemA protein domain-containing protein n=1 Tax=Tribonema minus TaxID=303371 RepID=A0A835ZEL7_9STRA|nr:hypothetical protein JKP88DRAFT_293793 [Tribonema minus]